MRSLKETFAPAAPYAMLPVRLSLFGTFFYHGTQKMFGLFGGPGLDGTAGFLGELGVPLPHLAAVLVGVIETAGSVAFLVGAGVRFFGLLVILVMLGGIAMVHAANGWNFMNGGMEYNVAVIAMCLALLFRGPGWASIEWADEEGAAPGTVS